MTMIEIIKERYNDLQLKNGSSVLTPIEQNAFRVFDKIGVPTVKNEEWKYTRIGNLFNKEYSLATEKAMT
ncbi:MAG: Fe-S cluster assembly protein SufD, partial [Bacteroidota bacterium]|nr:Fe-S cluster assembly protein SufD [Bacteroidota bacterium]